MRQQLPLLVRDLQPFFSTFGHSSKSFSEANGFRIDDSGGLKDDLFGRHSSSRLDKECECSSLLIIAVCRSRDRLPFRMDVSSPEPGVCLEFDSLARGKFHDRNLVGDRLDFRVLGLELGGVYYFDWFRSFYLQRE